MTEFEELCRYLPQGGDWPHAVLIESDTAEALRFAREAAAALLCGKKDCGCSICRRIREGSHPDVSLLDRGEGEIRIDDVRALRRDAVVMPVEGDRKVYLIRHAQNMNLQAQNAALKILEEPPEGVTFVLLCDSALSLLQTVRSRCVVFGAGGESEGEPDEESRALARAFAAAAATGRELPLAAFAIKHEKLQRAEFGNFFAALLELLEPALRTALGQPESDDPEVRALASLRPSRIVRLIALVRRRQQLLESNVGGAHLLATIPAELFAGEELR